MKALRWIGVAAFALATACSSQKVVDPPDPSLPVCDRMCEALSRLSCPEAKGDSGKSCEELCDEHQALPYETYDAEAIAQSRTVDAVRAAGAECKTE